MKKYSLNVARWQGGRGWEHWCRIELPDSLTDKTAIARAADVEHRWKGIDGDWKFELTKWEEVGHTIWKSKKEKV